MAIVSPSLIANARNVLFTKIRSGKPKEILESPQIVATPKSCLQ